MNWEEARAAALERDGNRCTVARLLGGSCSTAPLHVHHLVPRTEGGTDDLDNLLSACATHHPLLESLRREVLRIRDRDRRRFRCPHRHTNRMGREACERSLATA